MQPQQSASQPSAAAPRWWTVSARACLAVAFAGWVATVAGYAQHQERLALTAKAPVSLDDPEHLLDRISSWALLHSAEYFAKYRAALDPGAGFQKFWWLAGLEAFGLAVGVAATIFPFSHARILASGILAMGPAPDLPESAVEIVANYFRLGVTLPSYRVAQVVGSAVVPFASLAAAMVLGWNPASPGPDVTAVTPSPPEARGCTRVQAWMERFYLGAVDKVRRQALTACVVGQWICTAVGIAGYGVGVASGQWWHTHVPLVGVALAVQVVANTASAVALLPCTEGRGSGTSLAAQGAALSLSIWRLNRTWKAGLSLVAVRTGVTPPKGYVLFNASAVLWIVCATGVMTFMGFRAPQAGDEQLRALPYRIVGFLVAGPIELAGVLTLTAATLLTRNAEKERRMWAGETAFSQSGDRWWLMYTLVVYYVIAPEPFHGGVPMVFARSREAMVYGSLIVALGVSYMINKSTDPAVNAGLWMITGGFLAEACCAVLATDSDRGVHRYPARAAAALARLLPGTRPRRDPAAKPLLIARAADPEAGGPHTVRLLLPKPPSLSGSGGDLSSVSDVVLEKLIGAGSFASVFRARYAGAPCAVKVLSATSPHRRAAAKAEAELALSLRHPCVLQTFAVLDVNVPASTLADAATAASSSKSASPDGGGGSRPRLADGTSTALAEFAAVLGAPGREVGLAADSPPSPTAAAAPQTVAQTWIVQQLMDRGTLEHAIRKGVFRRPGHHRPGDGGSGGGGGGSVGASGPSVRHKPQSPPAPTKRAAAATARLPPPRLAAPNPVAAMLATLHDVASGLAYLHKVGIVHGDLKSANILLTSRSAGGIPGGRPPFGAVIADFGLSRALAPPPGVALCPTGPGPDTHIFTHTFGTAAYTAPEIVREGRLSSRADCYALGILLWEVWVGHQPYRNMPHAASIFYRVGVECRRPSLEGFGDAPPGYVALMTALWADAMHDRPTAADAARCLGAMLEAEVGRGGGGGGGGGGGEVESVAAARPASVPPPTSVMAEE